MSQTTIIISNLSKCHFVASDGNSASLASQVKSALSDPKLYTSSAATGGKDIISYWSELPFLNRIIAIFETEADASQAYSFLLEAYVRETAAHGLVLPKTARLSLQENLLQRSKSSDVLSENHTCRETAKTTSSSGSVSEELAGYEEPKPKPIDMYADLLKCGIDISKYNSEEQVKEVRYCCGSQASPALGRTRSLTKTLFKPPLIIDTNAGRNGNVAPLSPTITLDQS